MKQLLKEFIDVFAWTYKDLKGIPPKLAQQRIELDITLPPTHQVKYRLYPNYVIAIKPNIDKLLATRFMQFVEEATWLSPIVVVPKKKGKLRIYIDIKKLIATIKKDPYSLPFTNEVLNIVEGHEKYSFLDGYLGYQQMFITPKDKYKITFVID